MATKLVMPKLSDTMKEGSIVRWLKGEGDAIHAGEVIAEIQSDKATIEFEAYSDGVLRKIFVEPDQTVAVGEKIALMTDEGEEAPAEGTGEKEAAPKKAERKPQEEEKEKPEKKPHPKARKPPARHEPPAEEEVEAEEVEEEEPRTEAAAKAGEEGKESRAAAIGRMKPAEGLARVKFGGRGPQTGLSKASAAKVTAAARSQSDRDKPE